MRSRMQWRGTEVLQRVRKAELAAVEETTRAAAAAAAGARSGAAADIVAEPATQTGTGVSGRWGLFPRPHGDPHWELFVETGTAYQPGDNAKRRAMDQTYPELAKAIRRHRGQ